MPDVWSFRCRSKQCVLEHGISYLIKSFSSDKNELVPFSLHSEAADRDRPRPLEVAGRAKNRLFSLVEEAEWVVTGDADLKIPKWSVLLFRGNKPAEDLCLLALVSPPVDVASDSRGLCWTLKIWKFLYFVANFYPINEFNFFKVQHSPPESEAASTRCDTSASKQIFPAGFLPRNKRTDHLGICFEVTSLLKIFVYWC